jgi:hypothetical protein
MEPDIKTMLTQKIRAVERDPITWNKEAVWLNTRGRIKTKRSYRVYYYAAAAILLLLLAVNPLPQTSVPDPMTSKQGDKWQTHIQPEPTQPAGGQEVEKTDHSVLVHEANRVVGESKPEISSADPGSEDTPKPVEDKIEVHAELNYPEPTVISEVSEEQMIVPIVGVIGWSDQAVAIARLKKKKRLHKLEPSEKQWGDYSNNNNTLFFARIK